MMATLAWAVFALCAIWFLVSFVREPRRLRNGVLVLAALFAALIALITSSGHISAAILAVVLPILVIVFVFGYVALVLFLLVNGVLVIRREGRSLALILPLVAGLVLIAAPTIVIVGIATEGTIGGIVLPVIAFTVFGIAGYFGFVFASFVIYGILYRLKTGSPSAGVVLVLGSRIIEGRVPPLLAARLDRAIEVFRQREAAGDPPPLLICCGGQGSDESRAEADAMADYLIDQGIPEAYVRREDQSTTTHENLVFGRRIAEAERPGEPMLISTNDYHTFRTALLARELGLDAQVIPAKTARYYVPAAFLREFAAIVRGYLWVHVGMLALFAALVGFLVWEALQPR